MSTPIASPIQTGPGNPPDLGPPLFERLPFLLAAQDAELRHRGEDLIEVRRAVEVLARFHRTEPHDVRYEALEVSSGVAGIVRRYRVVAQSARFSCLVAMPAAFRDAIGLDTLGEIHDAAASRGVVVRQLHDEHDEHAVPFRRFAASAASGTGSLRLRAHVRTFAAIVDRSRILLPADPLDPSAGIVESSHSGLLGSVESLLEEQWSAARAWGEPAGEQAEPLTRQEREVLALLAAGRTDEQVGNRLKVSLRTVRRIYADMARRWAVRSRFEAGVVAARNGWV
ncbi:helix-turn-helix transcriptional regulator [Myceligenerans crystallogenes]|uniref:HTH luxR-type domain-containing protein n=1 Tax=Myceligenerans crystallogenes TaxID=316335 RepID=A0ABP4ZIB8_9MICO